MTEDFLLKRLQTGDEDALILLADRYRPYVAEVIRMVLGSRGTEADLEELCNDTFYALWTHGKVVRPGKLKAYLGVTARNKAKSLLRQTRVLPMDLDTIEIPDEAASPEDLAIRKELARKVRQAVDSLRPKDREIFLRYYYYFQDTQTIADQMGIPPATVRSRLQRGRDHLKKRLEQEVRP